MLLQSRDIECAGSFAIYAIYYSHGLEYAIWRIERAGSFLRFVRLLFARSGIVGCEQYLSGS